MGFKRPLVRIQSLGPETVCGNADGFFFAKMTRTSGLLAPEARENPPLPGGQAERRPSRWFESSHSDQKPSVETQTVSFLNILQLLLILAKEVIKKSGVLYIKIHHLTNNFCLRGKTHLNGKVFSYPIIEPRC